MNKKKNLIVFGILTLIIVVAAASRLIDHPFNFTPIIAIILFSAYYFKDYVLKFFMPLAVIFTSDYLLELKTGFGFHSGSWLIYGTFFLILFIAFKFFKKASFKNITFFSILSSVIFFLITNFALFYPISAIPNPVIGAYPHNFTGIIASYEAGLPFFRNMLIGDLFFTHILFGIYALVQKTMFLTPAYQR